ncbi:hypothetical protein [Streptomyces sp. NPDC056144]|uniref:hypothetical protein n=1 Tax=unclassified Streptomyces TaxID=2593676 RepID=UPI0035DF974E
MADTMSKKAKKSRKKALSRLEPRFATVGVTSPVPTGVSLCADLRRGINDLKKRIRKTHDLIVRIGRTIDELYTHPNTDPATIQQLEAQRMRLKEQLEEDQVNLDGLQIDYSFAGCGSQDGGRG